MNVARTDVLRFRVRQHQLDAEPAAGSGGADVALLDYGVQDTGTDGASWALALRGAPPFDPEHLALAWTWRGAPHAYRRADLAAVAVATAPLSEADAAKRIFDAAKPLKAAGVTALDALRNVARQLRDIVRTPTVKGEASRQLAERLDQPYLRYCRACKATHSYEQPFRLSALQGGLELEAGTSPPVLRRIPGLDPPLYRRLGSEADARFDGIRNYLRFYGPARVADVATFLDAPVKDIKAHWPADAVPAVVTGVELSGRPEARFVLADDTDALGAGGGAHGTVRLLGPHDPYLQLRDREVLVPDEARRKELWPVLGRPGAVAVDGEIVGAWRPRTSSGRLTVRIESWGPLGGRILAGVEHQAQRLAAFRGVVLAEVGLA